VPGQIRLLQALAIQDTTRRPAPNRRHAVNRSLRIRQSCAILAGAAAQPPYLPKPDLVSPEPTGEATFGEIERYSYSWYGLKQGAGCKPAYGISIVNGSAPDPELRSSCRAHSFRPGSAQGVLPETDRIRRLSLCSWTVGQAVFHFVKPPYPSIPNKKPPLCHATRQGFGLGGDNGDPCQPNDRLLLGASLHRGHLSRFRGPAQIICATNLR
jgi:hypothetical protein